MGAIEDIAQQLLAARGAQPVGPAMGDMVAEPRPISPVLADLVQGAREQLAGQARQFPTSYSDPEGDARAMSPETFVPQGVADWTRQAAPKDAAMMGQMVTLPQRAIDSAARFGQTGEYDPGPILEAAMLPMGAGLGGVPARAGETVLGAGMIPGAGSDALRSSVLRVRATNLRNEYNIANGFKQDNPALTRGTEGEQWLRDNPDRSTGVFHEVNVDPQKLAELRGARGEQKQIGTGSQYDQDFQDVLNSMRNNGVNPEQFSRPLVTVDRYGTAYLHEGNKRVRAAAALNTPTVPVEWRYLGGSERLSNAPHPLDFTSDPPR